MGLNLILGCIKTPATGNELQFPRLIVPPKVKDQKQPTQKPVLIVVGGGPAGMQAARVAAQRGYRVKLYERPAELGGQINLLVRVSHRVEIGDASRNIQRALLEAGVETHMGVEETAAPGE